MARRLGAGTIVGVDHDANGTFTVVLAVSATPPPRRRVRVEGTALTDTLETPSPGIEAASEYVFDEYYDPGDATSSIIETLFDSKATVPWRIEYSNGTKDTFNGWVGDIEPQEITERNYLVRRVTIVRTSTITRT